MQYCQSVDAPAFVHYGVDREPPPEPVPPNGYTFAVADLDGGELPFPDDSFDAVVASHVIEHVSSPTHLANEAFRVLKVGGVLYVECPSLRSLYFPSMPFRHEEFRSLNFFDDPTHVGRPQTPQSLHRLFRMFDGTVLESRYITSRRVQMRLPWLLLRALMQRDAALLEHAVWWGFGFAVYGIARKTTSTRCRYVVSRN